MTGARGSRGSGHGKATAPPEDTPAPAPQPSAPTPRHFCPDCCSPIDRPGRGRDARCSACRDEVGHARKRGGAVPDVPEWAQ
jgi:hypothetical protein